MHWKLLLTPPLAGAENMALDEALLERARATNETVFRVYAWSEPTLSFGRNQTARGAYDPDLARERGVAIVRRPTGGRSLLHHREVTYSVTAPITANGSLRESYDRINRLLVDGLRRLGVLVHIAKPLERSLPPSAAPCFERPAAGELIVDGLKLVGSAQWRDEGALLQHGSILVDDDQPLIAAHAGNAGIETSRAATLSGALGRSPAVNEVASALFESVRELECATAGELTFDESLRAAARPLVARYRDDSWTWRR